MEGFSSLPRRGLLPFEAEGSANLVELDHRPRFTPMIWSIRRTLGFELKKGEEEDKGKGRKIRKEIFVFPFILWEVSIFPPKETDSKREASFQNWHVLA